MCQGIVPPVGLDARNAAAFESSSCFSQLRQTTLASKRSSFTSQEACQSSRPTRSKGSSSEISCVSHRRAAATAGSALTGSDISEILQHVGDQNVCMIPSFFIRDSSVVGLISSFSAAPWAPRIRQLHRWSARTMWARSASSSVPSVGLTTCV